MSDLIDVGIIVSDEYSDEWHKCSGKLPVRMTNDYLFRALMQTNNRTLTRLISAVLNRDLNDFRSVEVTNPIALGRSIGDKCFVLDVRVLLNNNSSIDLEMQVYRDKHWNDRSLCYLCRMYDNLNIGEDYTDTKAALQINFLDFTLFEEYPEFFATYKLLNTKNGNCYSNKFIIYSIDMTRIDLATDEDKAIGLDIWARMFKARTWEELMDLARENTEIDDAISTVYRLISNDLIREECFRRNEFINYTMNQNAKIENLTRERDIFKEERDTFKEERDSTKQELDSTRQQLDESNEMIKMLQRQLQTLQTEKAKNNNPELL